jgi:hypothetical protein
VAIPQSSVMLIKLGSTKVVIHVTTYVLNGFPKIKFVFNEMVFNICRCQHLKQQMASI